jgi:hypothetical protein
LSGPNWWRDWRTIESMTYKPEMRYKNDESFWGRSLPNQNLWVVSRVTRRVCKKVDLAQLIICQNYYITWTVEKIVYWATFVFFKLLAKVNNHLFGENSPNLVTLVVFRGKCCNCPFRSATQRFKKFTS